MQILPPRIAAKIQSRGGSNNQSTLFTDYRPKPGGQARVWSEFLKFGNADRTIDINPGYRGLYIRGGRGGGKSHIGAAIACTRAYYDPQSRGLISANEYGQLETSSLVALAEFCEQFNIPLSPSGETVEETARMIARRRLCQIFDAQVLVLAGSKFGGSTEKAKQGGRGIQTRWAWLDEWAVADRIAMNVLNAALGRGNGSLDGFFWITSTINLQTPYNWIWELFDDPDRTEDKRELYKSVVLLSSDNDSLHPDFVKTLESSYTPEMIEIELRGEYAVTSEGKICKYFDRSKHLLPLHYIPTSPLHLSCDFNRSPSSSLLIQVHGDKVYVLEEFNLTDADTFQLADAIGARLQQLRPTQLYLYGDATGRAKTANSQQSNWDIIHQKLSRLGIPYVRRYKDVNPPVVDTINSMNCLFFQDRVLVDPKCKELVKDIESLKYDANGGIDKKTDLRRSHWIDELRYLCHALYPYNTVKTSSSVGKPLSVPSSLQHRR